MKKLIAASAAMLLISAMAAHAQTLDTIKDPKKDTTKRIEQASRYYGMVKIQPADLPPAVKTALQGKDYRGWESGQLYRSQNGEEYMIEMKKSGQTTIYKFDKNGKPFKEQS